MSDFIHRPGSEEEWEAMVRQLRLQPKAQPRPFFYARVQARLLAPAGATSAWRWLWRPAYAVVLGTMIFAISGDGAGTAPGPVASLRGSHAAQEAPR
jgi:hypothetical protein